MKDALKSQQALDDSYNLFHSDAFSREDETDDAQFYAKDRFVSHLDSVALSMIEKIIGQLIIEKDPVILDLMASWDSHIPESIHPSSLVGLGLNENELLRNKKISRRLIHDLNQNPYLPLEDDSFDVVINTVSVDYLVSPFEIFKEVGRVLKPGGLFLVIFSNRMFPQKATKIWRDSSESERVELVKRFFEEAGAFDSPEVFVSQGKPRPRDDKYAHLGIPSDPVYAVYAEKKGADNAGMRRIDALFTNQSQRLTASNEASESCLQALLCPHCGEKMKKWAVPNSPFSSWDTDFLYICFNDACPYVERGWQTMSGQGNPGMSYRFVYDPNRKSSIPIPIVNLNALKEGVVE